MQVDSDEPLVRICCPVTERFGNPDRLTLAPPRLLISPVNAGTEELGRLIGAAGSANFTKVARVAQLVRARR
jgi:hypothetical protein